MAPKAFKKTTSGPKKSRVTLEEVQPKPTFFNDNAEKDHYHSIVYRNCIQERGFQLESGSIFNMIAQRGWERLVAQPGAALIPVIREFYANAKEQHKANPGDFQALVRGKMVSYDRTTINDLYGLDDIENDDYTAWLAQGPDMDAVLELLAKPGTVLKKNRFSRTQLKPTSRAWHYFISAKLLPTMHVADVSKDRALLNYAIQTGLSIDVGRLIDGSIIACFSGKMQSGLRHPSLIYGLCLKAGVATSQSEEVQHPLSVMNHALLASFELKRMRAEAFPTDVPSSSQQPGSSEQPESSAPSFSLEERFTALQTEVHDIRDNQARWHQENRQQFQYFVDYTTSLNSMFQNCSLFQGSSSVVFPTPPVFSPVPPSAEEHESDDED